MPSAAHLPEPLTVEPAMRPLHLSGSAIADPPDIPHVHPDRPIGLGVAAHGGSRCGRDPGGQPGRGDADWRASHPGCSERLQKARRLPKNRKRSLPLSAQNWLPAVAAITVAAVLIVSGLVFWQRTRRSDLGIEAYRNGEKLLAQGQVEEAVSAFRNALAHAPQDVKSRAALGLALVQSGHFDEASSYLSGVVKARSSERPGLDGAGRDLSRRRRQETGAATLPAGALQGMARTRGVPAAERSTEIRRACCAMPDGEARRSPFCCR